MTIFVGVAARCSVTNMAISGLTTFLWFDNQALEVAQFYVDTFDNSRLGEISYYPAETPGRGGSVLSVEFELFAQHWVTLNGGPEFSHSPAVSFQISCDTQDEIDRLWSRFVDNGGQESRCGWCQDRWGVSWQIVPTQLPQFLASPHPEQAQHALLAMMAMSKFVIDDLRLPQD